MRTTLVVFLVSLLQCTSQVVVAKDIMESGQNITSESSSSFLVSAGQRFVLGFFPRPENKSESYLGIWYNSDQTQYPGKQTVVWVANRDIPVVSSNVGVFHIADDGNLVLEDASSKGRYWSTSISSASTATNKTRRVQLMDSGNLVLFHEEEDGDYIWQSFQHPTDTFLPGMQMDMDGMELRSGNFTFKMVPTQNYRKKRYVIYLNDQLYWENDGLNSDALSPDKLEYLTNWTEIDIPTSSRTKGVNRTMKLSATMNKSSTGTWETFYKKYMNTRIVMNSSGEIQYLKWEEEDSTGAGWTMLSNQPSDKCHIYNFCGNFSSCDIADDLRICKCLPGFKENQIQSDEGGSRFPGCNRSTLSLSDSRGMMFINLTMVRVTAPDFKSPAESEDECRISCLHMHLPRCQAYSYNRSVSDYDRVPLTCGIWTQDLTTLQVVQDDGAATASLSVLVNRSDIAPKAKSCEPCGIYVIPYPLSTGPSCGDATYNKFICNNSTGQLNFTIPSGESYRVTWVDQNTRRFYIQTSNSYRCDSSSQNRVLDPPFNVTNWCYGADEIEVSWDPAPEPPCNHLTDCNGWPHSTCRQKFHPGEKRCFCHSKYHWDASTLSCTQGEESKNHKLLLVVTLTVMLLLAFPVIFAYVWRIKTNPKIDRANILIQESLHDSERQVKGLIGLGGLEDKHSESIEVPFYTYRSIVAATDNFSESNKLGRGGYGPVYKGRFLGGQDIAVKRLSSFSTQGLEEFKNEIVLIAKLQHRNLVRLRGYCIKGDEKILLYEYMPNKSLDSFIFDRSRTLLLEWPMRFDIILGIARGLLYLHQDSRLRIIHRDLKSSNILLDEDMTPKISDFGLAKIFGGKETEASTERVVGTYGYMAPEYALDGYFSIKSDVFSFGVVLLEILSGKKNTGFFQFKQTATLLGYAWGLWTENRLMNLMDTSFSGTCNENQFTKCAQIALLCVQDEPGDRPTMSTVVTMLDSEIATIPIPTQPTFYAIRRTTSTTASSSSRPETTMQIESSYQEGR
ncbi:hypothetical protein HN51_043262 [Arachis hypogaea]|uniref:G-type lectin S-receptor-like serine/threonine-protein kinase At4g03230 n=1 Tax=Arachis ipaensis TaxID=130454 RepID=UPI0007AF02F1|nr:G-type lectin S-receptor-like serine/threonine-protein kinase At4g03230 [Arachis ipaensis]XP_025669487.1 G-type lectin S-receptor-like serine/threonine-protein kinase At4g03230 [Arachis hypogaea]QHN95407.1 G-type lectin S-receptor-like serine/threonine-protein kinase [Arachis hypogaea]